MHFQIIFVLLVLVGAAFASDCRSKPETGPCKALFTSWAYDPNTKECVEFTYGGCQGNDNRYLTRDECMNTCKN